MNKLNEQFGGLGKRVENRYDRVTKAVMSTIKATPLIAAILSGCTVDAQSGVEPANTNQIDTPQENVVQNKEELVYMALQASEGNSKVSTPVVSSEVLRVFIQEKDKPDNSVVALSGGELGNSLRTFLPEPLPEGQVAILSAFVDSSCSDERLESCTKRVVMVKVDEQDTECPHVRKEGNVCAVGNDEAPIPYAW